MPDTPLTEWLYESGIGENRAMLIEKGCVIKIRIERKFGELPGPKCGAIMLAKLSKKHGKGGFITLDDGNEAIIKKWPIQSEGMSINVEIIREAIQERTRLKPAVAIASDREARPAPALLDTIISSQIHVKKCLAHEGDIFAQHGWYELTEQAELGIFDFVGGQLIIDEVTAMTVIDVDGDGNQINLSKAAAKASARVISLLDLQGMIGVDFPALESKNDRMAVTNCFDEMMMDRCERTTINGFGFMQIVKKRTNASVIAILQRDRVANAAMTALRRAEYDCAQISSPNMQIIANPHIIEFIERYEWTNILIQRTGRSWQLIPESQFTEAHIDISAASV